MRRAVLYLKDILVALDSIQAFTAGFDVAGFQEDDKTLSAVIHKFEIIGEAAKGLPEVIRKQYPDVPWKEMAGMRDRLIHFYFGVDVPLVWETVQRRLPELRRQVQQILEEQQRQAP
jgi:uncharacterized protein with HEPN domain